MIANGNIKSGQAAFFNCGDGLNLYAYATNNQLRFIDLSELVHYKSANIDNNSSYDPEIPFFLMSEGSEQIPEMIAPHEGNLNTVPVKLEV